MKWTISEADAILKVYEKEARIAEYNIDADADYIAACQIVTDADWSGRTWIDGADACEWDNLLDRVADRLEPLMD